MSFESVIFKRTGPVTTITINRPHRLNALSIPAVHELIQALNDAGRDADTRVVVITGAGDAFCSGADIKEAPQMTPAIAQEVVGLYLDFIRAIRRIEKPVIARVNGPSLGGGSCAALACDIRIASERASFTFPFVNIGISGADMAASYLLPRLVGLGRACELLMTGEAVDARQAESIGLVNRVVPHEGLDAATSALAKRLASRPPMGLKFTKRALYGGLDKSFESQLEYEHFAQVACILTEDYEEGRRAFLEKRQPVFEGR